MEPDKSEITLSPDLEKPKMAAENDQNKTLSEVMEQEKEIKSQQESQRAKIRKMLENDADQLMIQENLWAEADQTRLMVKIIEKKLADLQIELEKSNISEANAKAANVKEDDEDDFYCKVFW